MDTFYSILFPSLVLLSLAGIILFLMRKAPQLERLSEEDRRRCDLSKAKKRGFFRRFWPFGKKQEGDFGGQGVLLFLEKIIKRIKIIFLKLENRFSGWGEKVQQKRKEKEALSRQNGISSDTKPENFQEKNQEETEDVKEEISRVTREKKSREGKRTFFQRRKRPQKTESVLPRKEREEKIERIGSALPRNDFFEKNMIEKIVANPKDVNSYKRLGEYYWEMDNFEYAKECFKQVMRLDPKNVGVKAKMKRIERILGK